MNGLWYPGVHFAVGDNVEYEVISATSMCIRSLFDDAVSK
jgi:hypothetical protein